MTNGMQTVVASLGRCLSILCGMFLITSAINLEKCQLPLGMESGQIPDDALSASSSFDSKSVGPPSSRIRLEKFGGAWCPKSQIGENTQEWLQVDFLGKITVITGIETQGRFGKGTGLEYTTEYFLEYWRPNSKTWIRYKNKNGDQIFIGNSDTKTAILRHLDPPIVASKIRIVPYSTYQRTVCLRLELYGCDSPDGLLSYNMPDGDIRGALIFKDETYDGSKSKVGAVRTMLRTGVGQLVDGYLGEKNPKGNQWVGWVRSSDQMPEVEFAFDTPRNFSSIRIFVNNHFKKGGFQVFKEAKVWLSLVEGTYSKKPIVFSYVPNTLLEGSYWITIPLNGGKVGQYLKIAFDISNKWFLMSEVEFDNEIVTSDVILTERNSEHQDSGSAEPTPIQIEIPLSTSGEINSLDSSGSSSTVASVEESGVPTRRQAVDTSPVQGLGDSYVGLIIGVMCAALILCTGVVAAVILRNRNTKKFCYTKSPPLKFASPKAHPPIKTKLPDISQERISIDVKDMRMTIHSKGQLEDAFGNSYIMDGNCTPRPPIPEHKPATISPFNGMNGIVGPHYVTDGSDYAEPEIISKCSATLPLLTPQTSSTESSSSNGSSELKGPSRIVTSPKTLEQRRKLPKCPQIAPPVYPNTGRLSIQGVSGNTLYGCALSPSTSAAPYCPSYLNVPEIPRAEIHFLEKLGEGEFGEVHLCDARNLNVPTSGSPFVAVKLLRKSANQDARKDFQKEMEVLSRLKDPNIVSLVGTCTNEEPWCMIVEYLKEGDLNQYLRRNQHSLGFGALIHIATQIASGMKYLESLNFVHRDLATRNCLVGSAPDHAVKIGDFGMARSIFCSDYYRFDGQYALPIRWMAWESLLLGRFTPKSDVWSFAVTLWEILTCGQQPFFELSDEQVVENIQRSSQQDPNTLCLCQPPLCPKEIYDLMQECWQYTDTLRPSFCDIFLFLQRKNIGFYHRP